MNNEEEEKKSTFYTGVGLIKNKKTPKPSIPSINKRAISAIPKVRNNYNQKNDYNNVGRRNRKYEKILFIPEDEKYYQKVNEIYGITPGVNFIKKIFSHDKAERAVPYLKLNIPETYWNDTEMFYVYNDWNNYGALNIIRNKKDFDLFHEFKKIEKEQYNRKLDDIEPFCVIRSKETDYENMVKVERYDKSRDNLGKDIGDGMVQRYIRCRGKNRKLEQLNKLKEMEKYKKNKLSIYDTQNNNNTIKNNNNSSNNNNDNNSEDEYHNQNYSGSNSLKDRKTSYTKPTVIRLEYKTRYNREKGSNVAYCLTNKNFVEPSIAPATKEIFEKYTQLTTLNTADEFSFCIYTMSGESVAPYEFYANQLVVYLQKWFKLLLKTIVCDFIKDERGIIFFLGVKSFTLVKDPDEIQMTITPSNINVNNEDNIKKFYKTWTCRLCQLSYPRSKITKIVTSKLLFKLKENLKKRGFYYFEHINNNIYGESQSCRVCDLCYTLLVTEQELMEMQMTIALCNNIEVQSEDTLIEGNTEPEGLVRAPQKYKNLNQWRIMFYFVKFYFMDYKKFPFEDGSQLPKDATPQEKKKGKTNYTLYITIFNQKISIPIFTEMKQFISYDEIELNTSKIFYFFTTENSNIKQILRNEEINFRIVLNDKYNEPLAECRTCCFNNYEDNFKTKPMTTKKILNFFSDYIKHFKCQMYLGLKNDGIVPTENLQMYCYKLPNPIYITDLNYYSYHILPNDWYELYVPPNTKIEDDMSNYNIEKQIDEIIEKLEGKDVKKKSKNVEEDEVYDPYDLLVQVQNKNDIINKIESIPIVLDKNFIDMKKEERKERPQTSKLRAKFNFEWRNNSKNVPGKKPTNNLFKIDEEIKKKRELEEKERKEKMKEHENRIKEEEKEREKIIKEGNNDHLEDLLKNIDNQLINMEN